MKKIYIELTDEQKQKLFPIADLLMQSNMDGKPGMVIAQVCFTGRDAVAVVAFIEKEKADRVVGVVSPKNIGKLMTDKMSQRRLEKARVQV